MKTRRRLRPEAPATVFQTKEEYVADYLREGILAGTFPRGTRLKQAEIAADLGISITPVREALKLLAAEGYVLGATHRGSVVAPFEVSTAAEIIELRALLETRLTAYALRRMTLGEMQQLELLAQEFDAASAAGDSNAARGANYRFHRYLYGLAGQPQTLHFVQVLWAKYPFDVIHRVGGRVGRAAEEHAQIIDAIVSRNVDAAESATRRHIYAGWNELMEELARHPDLANPGAAAADASAGHAAPPSSQEENP